MALGFYPGAGSLLPACALAVTAASFGSALGEFAGRAARLRRMQAFALAFGLVSGAAVAWNEAGTEAPRIEPLLHPERGLQELVPVWAEGTLTTDSTPAKDGFRSYVLRVQRLGLAAKGLSAELSYPGKARGEELRVLSRSGPEIDSGATIRARGSLSTNGPEGLLFAQRRDIVLIDSGNSIDRARSALRSGFRQALARIGRRSAGLLQALILGVKDSLAPEESGAFKAAGCSHILALSGEHLSVLAVLAIAALKPLFGPLRARLGGAALASLFMWVVGPGPSLLRAVLMVWIGAFALALDRPQDWLTVLALSFLVMVPLDPSGARTISFTLSYMAVWGLAVLSPRFAFLLGPCLPPLLRGSASASLAAQAAVSPLLAFTFGYLQFAGIPASMAAGPLVTAMMWWGMGAGLLCSILPFAAALAAPVSDCLYDLLMGVMNAAASVPTLPLPSLESRVAASLAVVCIAAMVYARPHAEYRASRRGPASAQLRLAPGPAGPPLFGGSRHEQALRPELPD